MAIGTIATPASWAIGTVLTPTWAQAVQDNINAFIGGTETYKSLQVDGAGGAASALAAGNIQASGTIKSLTSINKNLWLAGNQFICIAGSPQFTPSADIGGTGGYILSGSGTGAFAMLYIPAMYSANGNMAVATVAFRIKPGSTGTMTLAVYSQTNLSNTSTPVATLINSGTSSGSTEQTVTVTVTGSPVPTSDKIIFATVTSANTSDRVYAANVTFSAPVF